jgi:hypothetical protein
MMTAAMGWQIPSVMMKKGDSKKLAGINPNQHIIFKKSEKVNEVMQKFPKLSLTHITKARGRFRHTIGGYYHRPARQSMLIVGCLWAIQNKLCRWQHVTSMSDEVAAHVYRQLLPSFTKLRTMAELPDLPKRK